MRTNIVIDDQLVADAMKLSGVKTKREVVQTWEAAAELHMPCRRRRYTPRSPHDCLVARVALEHRTRLLHDDRDFALIAEVEPRLKLLPLT